MTTRLSMGQNRPLARADAADKWDLVPVPLRSDLTLFHMTHDYTAYWQAELGIEGHFEIALDARDLLFPTENVVGVLAAEIAARSAPTFAVVVTDYFGGAGGQGAVVSVGGGPIHPTANINSALREHQRAQRCSVNCNLYQSVIPTLGESRSRTDELVTSTELPRYEGGGRNFCGVIVYNIRPPHHAQLFPRPGNCRLAT